MTIWWIIAGLGGAAVVWALLSSWRRRRHDGDMGTLSDQWMAEQRLRKDSDPNR
jgi:hypothetical protein